jgi:hypothetical protein
MPKPKAYDPIEGQKFQILVLCPGDREYEHCDYAVDNNEKNHLLGEYMLAYSPGHSFKVVTLPSKYWPKKKDVL